MDSLSSRLSSKASSRSFNTDKSHMAESDGFKSSSTTKITTRADRSTRTAFLQTGIRPVGAKLIAPKHALPPHPPELRAPESVYDFCNVRQLNPQDVDVRLYEINSRKSTSTRENFIAPQIYDLRVELQRREKPSVHRPSEALQLIQSHEEHNIISKDFGCQPARIKRKHIYYFAGGGWQTPPAKEHWKLCAHLANAMTEKGHPTTVTLVCHPLAPNAPGKTTMPLLERLYYEILPTTPPPSMLDGETEESGERTDTEPKMDGNDSAMDGSLMPDVSKDSNADPVRKKNKTRFIENEEEVIFAGDSSGGNIALSLVLNVLAENRHVRVPNQIFLISPAVDLRNTNPDILQYEKSDPLMSKKYIDQMAKAWAGDDRGNPVFSPLLRDLSILRDRQVVVNGIIGLADVLAPDAQKLMVACKRENITGEWLQWEKQMHCFPLAFSYKMLPESTEAVEWMVDTLVKPHPF